MLIPFGIIIIDGVLNRWVVSKILNRILTAINGFLEKSSLYVYITHWSATCLIVYFMSNTNAAIQVLAVAFITIVFSGMLYLYEKKCKNCIPILIICSIIFIANIVACGFILK